jgi:hypothetical protein
MNNAKKILETSNSSIENIVKCVIYLSVLLYIIIISLTILLSF